MATVTIKSNSDKKTLLLMQLAEELGLDAEVQDVEKLDVSAMVKGIGRKATDEELIDYLSKDLDAKTIDLNTAFSKYTDQQ